MWPVFAVWPAERASATSDFFMDGSPFVSADGWFCATITRLQAIIYRLLSFSEAVNNYFVAAVDRVKVSGLF